MIKIKIKLLKVMTDISLFVLSWDKLAQKVWKLDRQCTCMTTLTCLFFMSIQFINCIKNDRLIHLLYWSLNVIFYLFKLSLLLFFLSFFLSVFNNHILIVHVFLIVLCTMYMYNFNWEANKLIIYTSSLSFNATLSLIRDYFNLNLF